ncbi:hypothetical protein HID58_001887, partial [Brassica napus]
DKTWRDLEAFWLLPLSIRTSNNCLTDQLMPGAEENLPLPHTSGHIPHTGVALKIAVEGGEALSLSRLYKKTHQHADGTFVDARVERIHNGVEAQIQEV